MKTLVSATILLISLTNAAAQARATSAAPVVPSAPPSRVTTASPGQPLSSSTSGVVVGTQTLQTGDLEDQARERVLVVPGPDLKPEALADISEDLTVMCRIFDKTLYPSQRSTATTAYLHDVPLLGRLFTQQFGRTQGLYLDGYGALFFLPVDLPLVPPQEKEEPKPEEPADRVWSQTRNELRGHQETRDAGETRPAYDAQKVENLKTTLMKTLRHAANLRIRPQDQITVVVGSHSSTGGSAQEHLRYLYLQERRFVPTRDRKRPDAAEADPAATLVLRAAKSDLDALAAGKLTAEQFAPKVQTLWTGARPQPPEPTPPQTYGPTSR